MDQQYIPFFICGQLIRTITTTAEIHKRLQGLGMNQKTYNSSSLTENVQ